MNARELRGWYAKPQTKINNRVYACWRDMMNRCYKKTNKSYKYYGGRGIVVCKRWHSLKNFRADVVMIPDGLSLDRKDNNKGYSPSNCKFSTKKEQNWNRSVTRMITFRGETKPIGAWEVELGFKEGSLRNWINKGLTPAKAITLKPVFLQLRSFGDGKLRGVGKG